MKQSINRLKIVNGHIKASLTNEEKVVTMEINEENRVAILTMNSPKTLNALSKDIWTCLNDYLVQIEGDNRINSVIVTGTGKSFSAGADLKQLHEVTYPQLYLNNFFERTWSRVLPSFKKPIIAAVNGFCFGGGLELALMCDIIIASEKAQLALPEIKLGLFPGAGGTQRLIRQCGKSKAMEMILTGEPITAQDALSHKIVSAVVPHEELMDRAKKLAKQISKLSMVSTAVAKQAISYSQESNLSEGLKYENAMFNALFGTQVFYS